MTALEEAFRDLAAVLDELELPFAVGGSFASSAFGVPRSTLDVDLVVELSPEEAYHLARLAAPWFAGDPEEARRRPDGRPKGGRSGREWARGNPRAGS